MVLDAQTENFAKSKPHLYEATLSKDYIHRGQVINARIDKARQPDGKEAHREVVEHPGGVVILPVLNDGRIILIEQWRYALEHPLIEVPAGKLDPGERGNPLEAAKRELLEETGYYAQHWEEKSSIYTSPGFCDEKLWLFIASGLELATHTVEKPDDEFIDVLVVTPEEAYEMVKAGRIQDAKTICLLCFLLFKSH